MSDGIVIAGGGLAAQRCAETLRARGYDGPIRMVCGEPQPPTTARRCPRPCSPAPRPTTASRFRARRLVRRPRRRAAARRARRGARPTRRASRSRRHALRLRAAADRHRQPRRAACRCSTALPTSTRCARSTTRARCAPRSPRAARLASSARASSARRSRPPRARPACEVTMVEATPRRWRVLGAGGRAWFADLHRSEGVDVLPRRARRAAHGRSASSDLTLLDGRRVACDRGRSRASASSRHGLAGRQRPRPRGRPRRCRGPHRAPPACFAAGDANRPRAREHREAAARQGMLGRAARCSASPSSRRRRRELLERPLRRAGPYPAMRPGPTRSRSTAIPRARDFTATFTSSGRPVAALLVGRSHALPTRARGSRPQTRGPP